MLSKHAGFTLIEILVVISIIGLLATLSLTSFTTAQKQAKDTQRKSDLKQYQAGLLGYASKNGGFYPTNASTDASVTLCGYLTLTTCPKDPKDPTTTYRYTSDGAGGGGPTATTYVLYATLDGITPTTYWLVCSNGKSGTNAAIPAAGVCPL